MHPVTLIPRHLTEKLASTLRTTRVINIVGPRQTGKTTLVRDMVEAARFLDLDDESLFASLTLRPFNAAEIRRAGPCRLLDVVAGESSLSAKHLPAPAPFQRSDAIDLLVRGGFPEIRPLEDRDRMARYDSYVNSIVERDIAPVAEIRRPDTLRRMINQLAHRTAEELNVTSLC